MGRVGLFRRSLRSLVMVVYGFKGYFDGIPAVVYRGRGIQSGEKLTFQTVQVCEICGGILGGAKNHLTHSLPYIF